jgi:hypothetical protein
METVMADEFERFLAEALSPAARAPDRSFVSRVQARIALDERLRHERSAMLRTLAIEVLAIAAVGAGLVWLTQAKPVAGFFADSPAVALAALILGFGFLVLLFSGQTDEPSAGTVELQPISNT